MEHSMLPASLKCAEQWSIREAAVLRLEHPGTPVMAATAQLRPCPMCSSCQGGVLEPFKADCQRSETQQRSTLRTCTARGLPGSTQRTCLRVVPRGASVLLPAVLRQCDRASRDDGCAGMAGAIVHSVWGLSRCPRSTHSDRDWPARANVAQSMTPRYAIPYSHRISNLRPNLY